MPQAHIFDFVRTPLAKADGGLQTIAPSELLTQVLAALRNRSTLDTAKVAEVFLGLADAAADGNLMRGALLNAGFDPSVAGVQVSRRTASGLDAVNFAAAHIMAGQGGIAIALGLAAGLAGASAALGAQHISDPLSAYRNRQIPAGISADLLATRRRYGRRELESYALESRRRALAARQEGRFARSVINIVDEIGVSVLQRDEWLEDEMAATTLESLPPAWADVGATGFDSIALTRYPQLEAIEHVHSAGTSAGDADGAAGVLLADGDLGRSVGWTARARVRAFHACGTEPTLALDGIVPAALRALERARMSSTDIDLYSLNEPFAAVPLDFMESLGVPHERVNGNGGALAFGEPHGAIGTIMLGIVLEELERTGKSTALIAVGGGGMATATVIERI